MVQFPSSLEFARAAVPFLRALPRYLRDVPGEPALKHYGSGESGHWAVQINQQVAGALAYNGLMSLHIKEVCTAVREESLHLLPGDILCDERYEVEVLP